MHHEKVAERLSKMELILLFPFSSKFINGVTVVRWLDTVLLPMMVFVHVNPKNAAKSFHSYGQPLYGDAWREHSRCYS